MMIPIKCHHLHVHQEPPHPPRLQEETWRTGGALTGFLLFPSFSGTSTSSKTPGRDLEDRWSLYKVSDVWYWWNFHRNFWRIIHIIWHQLLVHQESLQVHQEFLSLPRLQEETWRTGGVLTGFLLFLSFSGTSSSSKTPGRDCEDRWSLEEFLMLDIDETFTGTSDR